MSMLAMTCITIGGVVTSSFAFSPHQSAFRARETAHGLHAVRGSDGEAHVQKVRNSVMDQMWKATSGIAAAGLLAASLSFSSPAFAENELAAKYGGGLDTSLVDQNCLVDKCSAQAKACLADDPDCRKGLTCTAKCLGDNYCITGCMARYGDDNLDNLLKCTIEDNECIKIAILPGGEDKFGEEPKSIAPTVRNFDPRTLEGSWYKVSLTEFILNALLAPRVGP